MKDGRISRRKMIKTAGMSVGAISTVGFSKVLPDSKSSKKDSSYFKDRVAFVTGGARGIGLAIAENLASKGVHCVLFDIAENIPTVKYDLASDQDLVDAEKTIKSYGVKCLTFKGDVRNYSRLQETVQNTINELGRLDFVIANAGVTRNGNLNAHTSEDISDLLNVNIAGVINTIKACSEHLVEQEFGRIVTISSIAGKEGYAAFPVYCATKWAIVGLAKSIAAQLGKHQVTSNIICPGFVNTPLLLNNHMLEMFGEGSTMDKEQRFRGFATNANKLPVDFLDAREIAQMTTFLCSDEASQITGETFVVDAGNTV